MPTAPSVARPSPRANKRSVPFVATAVVAVAVVTAAVLLIVSSVLEEPTRVELVVENPTVYEMNVRVASADDGSGLGLGTVAPESSRTFPGVIDQGDRWQLEFSSGGVVAAELVVDRVEIESSSVIVPSSAEGVLRDAGVAPSP